VQGCSSQPLVVINWNHGCILVVWSRDQSFLTSNYSENCLENWSSNTLNSLDTNVYSISLMFSHQKCKIPWAWVLEVWRRWEQVLPPCHRADICHLQGSCHLHLDQPVRSEHGLCSLRQIFFFLSGSWCSYVCSSYRLGPYYINTRMKMYLSAHGLSA